MIRDEVFYLDQHSIRINYFKDTKFKKMDQ